MAERDALCHRPVLARSRGDDDKKRARRGLFLRRRYRDGSIYRLQNGCRFPELLKNQKIAQSRRQDNPRRLFQRRFGFSHIVAIRADKHFRRRSQRRYAHGERSHGLAFVVAHSYGVRFFYGTGDKAAQIPQKFRFLRGVIPVFPVIK